MAILYCAEQLDGIAAAAIITRHAQLRRTKIRFGGYIEHSTQELKSMPKEAIFIVDICPTEQQLALIKNIPIYYWSTHDESAPQIETKIYDKDDKKCAAELARQRFLPKDNVAAKLAELGRQVTDYELSEQAEKLSDLIASGYNPTDLINSLAKGVFWSKRFEEEHTRYVQRKQTAYDKLLETLTIKRYVDHNFGFASAKRALTSADAGQKILMIHKGVDVSVTIYKDGRFYFRKRNECPLNLKKIARFFDGGGKEYASGAHMEPPKSYESAIDYLDRKLKQYFIDNSNV